MLKELGAAIAAERTRQGLRSSDLGVDTLVVEAIEAGRPGITTTQLEAIARALQLDPIALRAGEIQPRPRPSIFLRHRGRQDFASGDEVVLDGALEHARSRNKLAKLLGEPAGHFPDHTLASRGVAADAPNAAAHQGYALARELRHALGNDSDALVDLREIAEHACGITILVRRLATVGSSALAIKARDAAAIVLAALPHKREPSARVWIAHELCHLFFDADTAGVHIVVDFDGERHVHQAEQRARAFAAELLIPDAGLRKLIGPPASVTAEARARGLVARARDAFGSTWQVAANHLANRGFVAMELRDWLESQQPPAPSREWATALPVVDGPSIEVATLARRAYDAGHLTDGEVRALVGLDVMAPLPWER